MTLKPVDKNTLKPIEEQATKIIETVKDKLLFKKKKSFRKAHPFLFALTCIGQGLLFLLPLAVWLVLTLYVYPAANTPLLIVGGAGALLLGVGFVNLTMRGFGKRYLGCLSVPILGLGGVLTALSALILYSPEIYKQFDKDIIIRYVINIGAMIFLTIGYGLFRGGVQSYLKKRGMSKSRIKKLKKGGLRCYLWYTDVHEETKMGAAYPLNILFTVVFFFSVLMNIFFGWMRAFIPVTGGMMVASCVLALLMALFVLIKGRSDKRFITWLGAFVWLILTAGVTYIEVMLTVGDVSNMFLLK